MTPACKSFWQSTACYRAYSSGHHNTQSKKSIQYVIRFATIYKWFNLKESKQVFWIPSHCFWGIKIIFQVEVIAYLYHLCFELPSTGNCTYPWQRHICKCDKLKCMSGFWRGGLLLQKNISPMSLHYQSLWKLEITGNQILSFSISFSVLVALLTQTLKSFYWEHASELWKLQNIQVKAQYYMSNFLREKYLL